MTRAAASVKPRWGTVVNRFPPRPAIQYDRLRGLVCGSGPPQRSTVGAGLWRLGLSGSLHSSAPSRLTTGHDAMRNTDGTVTGTAPPEPVWRQRAVGKNDRSSPLAQPAAGAATLRNGRGVASRSTTKGQQPDGNGVIDPHRCTATMLGRGRAFG